MPAPFDPYYLWLGIPSEEQPPNHYRLLGIRLFESNPEVIEMAADGRTVHLRTFQIGPHADVSQRLLNEVAAARVCLLNPAKKAAYDSQLRAAQQPPAPAAAPPADEEADPVAVFERIVDSRPSLPHRRGPKWPVKIPPMVITVAAGVGIGILLVAIIAFMRHPASQPGPPDTSIAAREPKAKPPQPAADPKPIPTAPPTSSLPPPLAVAPFDAVQARKHQEAWAKHLGVPVETTNSIGMKLVLIPPGEFMMGSRESAEELAKAFQPGIDPERFLTDQPLLRTEQPQHRVRITKPFYMGVYEVTVGEFRKFVEATAYKTEPERDGKGGYGGGGESRLQQKPDFTWRNSGVVQTDEHPVANLTWNDAVAFGDWLSRKDGAKYRLPTEAEWEYACRAGTTTRWCSGDDETLLGEYAWFAGNLGGHRHPVGQKKPNAWGLYDMHGDVWEWCEDWFDSGYYKKSMADDPTGPSGGSNRVGRGGGWISGARFCRSADRVDYGPGRRAMGFRVSQLADV